MKQPDLASQLTPFLKAADNHLDEFDNMVAADNKQIEEIARAEQQRIADEQQRKEEEADMALKAEQAERDRVIELQNELSRLAGTGLVVNNSVRHISFFLLITTDFHLIAMRLLRVAQCHLQRPGRTRLQAVQSCSRLLLHKP